MSRKHRNVPIFIPHLGCPHQCVFCNQHSISEQIGFQEEQVEHLLDIALPPASSDAVPTEIAFFGGSFTGLDRAFMIRLLELATNFIRQGRATSIRLSTRPDYISEEILTLLSSYPVHQIELGLQSMDDAVLLASGRGHTAADSERACRAVVAAGFSLTGQMMIGLPDSTIEKELETARRVCTLGVSAVRIYPTVVFYGTPLCELAQRGEYVPLSVREAVVRSADVLEIFHGAGIPCIRIGLCATDALTDATAVYAGPNHPALGELVLSECAYRSLRSAVCDAGVEGREITLKVPRFAVSQTVGQHRCNLERLYAECGTRIRRVIGADVDQICIAGSRSLSK